jgi:hypothetical protein
MVGAVVDQGTDTESSSPQALPVNKATDPAAVILDPAFRLRRRRVSFKVGFGLLMDLWAMGLQFFWWTVCGPEEGKTDRKVDAREARPPWRQNPTGVRPHPLSLCPLSSRATRTPETEGDGGGYPHRLRRPHRRPGTHPAPSLPVR